MPYQYSLLDECVTVIPHGRQHPVSGLVSGWGGGLAGHSEGVDEGLGMLLAHLLEMCLDEAGHQRPGGVNTGNQLRYHLQTNNKYITFVAHCTQFNQFALYIVLLSD